MMLLHEQVDSMMIFSLQNSCKDVSSQILSTSSDKENTQKAGILGKLCSAISFKKNLCIILVYHHLFFVMLNIKAQANT